jgi:hypothetical protein
MSGVRVIAAHPFHMFWGKGDHQSGPIHMRWFDLFTAMMWGS